MESVFIVKIEHRMGVKSKDELGDERYKVLREGATEPAFSGALLNNKEKGVYMCGYCGEALFHSDNKYDSGSGWPSFDTAITGKVNTKEDRTLGIVRTEIMCANCGSHLGHVFEDGPQDTTGMRYCVNSLSLDFEGEADGKHS